MSERPQARAAAVGSRHGASTSAAVLAVPGFAGLHLTKDANEGVLVARLKDLSQAENARAALEPLLEELRREHGLRGGQDIFTAERIRFEAAKYSITELMQWRSVVAAAPAAAEFFAVGVEQNAIVLEGVHRCDVAEVERHLATTSVPRDAVRVNGR